MDDTISRQDAIDLWEKYHPTIAVDAMQYDAELRQLPSAQPDLDEWCTDCKEYDQEKHCCPRWNRVIRETAEEVRQNAEAEPRWIPVEERLPEEYKDVLVSVHFLGLETQHKNGWNDHIKESWYVDIANYIDGSWVSCSDEYKVGKSRHIITAWMPLPKPYERSEDE